MTMTMTTTPTTWKDVVVVVVVVVLAVLIPMPQTLRNVVDNDVARRLEFDFECLGLLRRHVGPCHEYLVRKFENSSWRYASGERWTRHHSCGSSGAVVVVAVCWW